MITFVIEQEELPRRRDKLYESRGSRTVLWEGLSEILGPDPIIGNPFRTPRQTIDMKSIKNIFNDLSKSKELIRL